MQVNRGLVFWGLALVTAGVVGLAVSQSWIDGGLLAGAWRLWPVILIAIGLSIVASRTPFAMLGTVVAALVVGVAGGAFFAAGPGMVSCGGEPGGATSTSSGEFTEPLAKVNLELNCGTLNVGMADGPGWRAVTASDADDQPAIEEGPASLDIFSGEGRSFPFDRSRQVWTVTLGQDVTYEIGGTLNAGDASLDLQDGLFDAIGLTSNASSVELLLRGSTVEDLNLQVNAGSLSIVADADSDLAGQIGTNAGSVDLCVPDGVGLQIIVTSSVAFAHNLDDSGLTESDDTFTSAGFDTAEHKVVLQVQGNAASFDLNPEDGCE